MTTQDQRARWAWEGFGANDPMAPMNNGVPEPTALQLATVTRAFPHTVVLPEPAGRVLETHGRYQVVTNGLGGRTTRTAPAVRPASEPAIKFLRDLVAEVCPDVDDTFTQSVIDQGADRVRQAIDRLKAKRDATRAARPAAQRASANMGTPDVPAGRYAVENGDGVLRFYKVDRPTEGRWAGYTFVKVMASDEEHPVRGKAGVAVLHKIVEAGIAACMARYGQEIGRCGRCGRTLTDATSRSYGIGPECRAKVA
jgi:Family of unknown function (DUF6011)